MIRITNENAAYLCWQRSILLAYYILPIYFILDDSALMHTALLIRALAEVHALQNALKIELKGDILTVTIHSKFYIKSSHNSPVILYMGDSRKVPQFWLWSSKI